MNTMVNGSMIKEMDMESKHQIMETFMMDNG